MILPNPRTNRALTPLLLGRSLRMEWTLLDCKFGESPDTESGNSFDGICVMSGRKDVVMREQGLRERCGPRS